jgi:hypothetical protein
MTRYATMLWSDRDDAPVATGGYHPPRAALLARSARISTWEPLDLAVDGAPTDYLANDAGFRLCSAKLKETISNNLSSDDDVQWLAAKVVGPQDGEFEYFVLHFPSLPEVLDPKHTLFGEGESVIRPVIAAERAGSRNIFVYSRYAVGPVISSRMRRAIVAADCSGIYYGTIRSV